MGKIVCVQVTLREIDEILENDPRLCDLFLLVYFTKFNGNSEVFISAVTSGLQEKLKTNKKLSVTTALDRWLKEQHSSFCSLS